MILTGIVVAALIVVFMGAALAQAYRLGISLRQAVFYLPLKLAYRIREGNIRTARNAEAPVIYAVAYQSLLDPALLLALLPDDTLHILDEAAAESPWLEPYRELARTIAFNAQHVFLSRRLVRHLKGKGRLAVYFPQTVEPDAKSFRLFRAVARIALKAGADIVPVHIDGARHLPFSLASKDSAPRHWFPRLSIGTLEAISLDAVSARAVRAPAGTANTLFDRLAEARVAASSRPVTLFAAFTRAARRLGADRIIIEDIVTGALTYRRLLIAGRVLGSRFAAISSSGEAVGLMLPNANGMVSSFIGLQSAGCAAAMINYTAGSANLLAAIRMAQIRTVVSSRAFVEKAQLGEIVAAIDKSGTRILWLEDIRKDVTAWEKLAGALFWRWPLNRPDAASTSVILFTSGSEGLPKGVLLTHQNILANAAQVEARIAFSPADTLFNALPVFHSFGLTGGTILPLLYGVRLFLYPSPLHYKQIPEFAARVKPTIMFGTDTFLAAYARTAKDDDFASLRLVVAGAEPVRAETRRVWRERFNAEIVEGYGLTEAAPVVSVNSRSHSRDGTVGRLLPGMRVRVEPVEGIEAGGRLWISGPNVMSGYIVADRPGAFEPPLGGWLDTGDIVVFDRDGYLTILGRARRFAKIAGEMVSLGAVEMLVQSLWPEDRHAAVAVPDAKRGERIVLLTTASAASKTELRAFGRKAGAADLMLPDAIVHVSDIPILGSGKTDYAGVRRLAMERLGLDKAA